MDFQNMLLQFTARANFVSWATTVAATVIARSTNISVSGIIIIAVNTTRQLWKDLEPSATFIWTINPLLVSIDVTSKLL